VGTTNDTKVSSWNDSSGNSRTVTQGNSSSQPYYESSGINGHAALNFNHLHPATQYLLTSLSYSDASPISVVAVFQPHTLSTNMLFANRGQTGLDASSHLQTSTLTASSALVSDTPYVVSFIRTGTTGSLIRINGTQVASGSTSSYSTTRTINIGFDQVNTPWSGYIGDVSIFYGTINSSDLTSLETYFGTKYGITIAVTPVSQISNLEENQSSTGTVLSAIDASGRYVQGVSAGTPADTPVG
jgi:hypothetical protein